MKKFILITLVVLLYANTTNAQYKVNRTIYNYRAYSYEAGDPYNPTLCGVLSFIIPGVGQMVAQESGRGAAFLVADIGFTIIYFIGTVQMGNDPAELNGAGAVLIGAAGILTTTIWATVDAVRVAKVNNLAWRDKNNTGFNLQLEPFVLPLNTNNSTEAQIGLCLRINF